MSLLSGVPLTSFLKTSFGALLIEQKIVTLHGNFKIIFFQSFMNNTNNAAEIEVLRKKLDLLVRTGELLMESAADTSRARRNMERAAAYLGFAPENLHMDIRYNILQVNVSDETHSFSKMQRCNKHKIDMLVIEGISKLTWKALAQDYTLEQYEQELEEIAHGKRYYTPWQIAIGSGFACGGFCVQFGCDWTCFWYASIAAILGFRLKMFLDKSGSNVYFNVAVGAFISTILAWLSSYLSAPVIQNALPSALASLLHSETPQHAMLACGLWIVPGVPLINSVNDLIDNNLENGLVRSINTILTMVAMAFGILLAIKCMHIDNFVKDLSIVPHHDFWEYALAAAISGMGFATIYNIRYKYQWWIAIGAIIVVCSRNFVNLGPETGNVGLGMGLVVGSLVGSALISIINIKMVHIFHTPHQVLTIPAVIPIVPGVLLYRALYGFIEMETMAGGVEIGMKNAINGTLTFICIALGVAIPNIFARKWIAPNRKAKLNQLIEERRKKGEFVELQEIKQ